MLAGPCELPDETRAIFGGPTEPCLGPRWASLHDRVLAMLQQLLDVSLPPYLIPGSGTAALDCALLNLFEPGQRVVIANTGFFGDRIVQLGHAQGLDVVEVAVPVGRPVDVDAIARAAVGARGIVLCHVETSTGVRHPIEALGAIARANDALLVVDAIASAGGDPLQVDARGIDCLVTSTQKGLEAPPGLGIIALAERGRERMLARVQRVPSYFFDLRIWDWYRREWGAFHPHPATMPSNLIWALAASLERILAHGTRAWIAERARLSRRLRDGLAALGHAPVPPADAASNMIVVAHAPEASTIASYLAEHGILVSGGLPPLPNRALRIGLMGRTATDAMVDRLLDALGARSA